MKMKKNDKNYFVLYNRDIGWEKDLDEQDMDEEDMDEQDMKRAEGMMLYDKVKFFGDRKKATAFALNRLSETPIVARRLKDTEQNNGEKYVVAAFFKEKYHDLSYLGYYAGNPPISTHEVFRCNPGEVESLVEKLAKEEPDKILLGIEEKLLP